MITATYVYDLDVLTSGLSCSHIDLFVCCTCKVHSIVTQRFSKGRTTIVILTKSVNSYYHNQRSCQHLSPYSLLRNTIQFTSESSWYSACHLIPSPYLHQLRLSLPMGLKIISSRPGQAQFDQSSLFQRNGTSASS